MSIPEAWAAPPFACLYALIALKDLVAMGLKYPGVIAMMSKRAVSRELMKELADSSLLAE